MADVDAPPQPASSVSLRKRSGRFLASFGTLLALAAGILVVSDFGMAQKATGTDNPDFALRLTGGDVRGPGPFQLQMNSGAELDGDTPSTVSGPAGNLDHGDLFYDNRTGSGSRLYTADHPMAVYPTSGDPDSDGCQDAISTFGVWSVRPVAGQVLCVQTTEGQIIAMAVKQVQPESVEFDDTVLG